MWQRFFLGLSIAALGVVAIFVLAGDELWSATPQPVSATPHPGYRLLTTKAYLTPDFDEQTFDDLWQTWDAKSRQVAETATLIERRRLISRRYGLASEPTLANAGLVQYAPTSAVNDPHATAWAMNCLACHGGKVAGRFIPGLPNTLYDLQTLTENVRATKQRLGKPLSHMDRGSQIVPLSGSVGTTNAVAFGKLLLNYRDADLNLLDKRLPPFLLHHDMDAPPWWNVKKKQRLYIDGFAPKSPRALMQFLLIPKNGPDKFRDWEADYAQVLAWIESLEPPQYPWEIDRPLAARGRVVFNRVCAECHGTYGKEGVYPERNIPIAEIGTDRVRFDALAGDGRRQYARSWFARDATVETIVDPVGYVAPPLDGVWASAPYLHNGSVPTLWHVLHPTKRPVVWQRTEDGYDRQRVGLEVVEDTELPDAEQLPPARRRWFDTRLWGKSSQGHDFPDLLDEPEKQAVLEYLKTL